METLRNIETTEFKTVSSTDLAYCKFGSSVSKCVSESWEWIEDYLENKVDRYPLFWGIFEGGMISWV